MQTSHGWPPPSGRRLWTWVHKRRLSELTERTRRGARDGHGSAAVEYAVSGAPRVRLAGTATRRRRAGPQGPEGKSSRSSGRRRPWQGSGTKGPSPGTRGRWGSHPRSRGFTQRPDPDRGADVAVVAPGADGPHEELRPGLRDEHYRLAPAAHGEGWAAAVHDVMAEHGPMLPKP